MAIRGRVFCTLFLAFLLPGCGGYFSGQWPNLAEGFEDAAERDAALAAVGQLANEGDAGEADVAPVAQETGQGPAPDSAGPPGATVSSQPAQPQESPVSPLSPETLAGLTVELENATNAIAEARQAYEDAKAAFMGDNENRTRGRWLTAQLKLTALSRAGDGLSPVLGKLRPIARECGSHDDAAACGLGLRAANAAAAVAAYLARERLYLADQDPAAPS